MKIASVRSYLMSCPLAQPVSFRFRGGEHTIVKRDAMFIRVETESGLIGYAPGPASERAHRIMDEVVAPFLVGRTLADPDALRVQFLQGPGTDAEAARVYCAAEIALYDIAGQARGVPVSELLGGRVRDRVRVYGSTGSYLTPDAHCEEAAALAETGFGAYKFSPAAGIEDDLAAVQQIREAAGPYFDLMVDAHTWWQMGDCNYSQEAIEELAGALASNNIAWLEEPLPPDHHEGYLRLKEKDLIPLASGKLAPDEHTLLKLIATQAVDYVQMDVCLDGGYAKARRVFAEIARQGLRFAFHSSGTALEAIAAAQLGVCWPALVVEWLEYPCYHARGGAGACPFPLATEILKEPLEIARGHLTVPRTPGLGVTVDLGVVERYPWIPGPWSYFRTDSPAETRPMTAERYGRWQRRTA